MECQEIERLFDRYFDHEISRLEYQALRGHLMRCGACRESFLNLQFALEFFEALPAETPSETWTERLIANIPVLEKRKIRRRGRRIYGVAACIIFAVVVTVMDGAVGGPGAAMLITPAGRKHTLVGPGRTWVIPKGSILQGDLYVRGDVVIQGEVRGDVCVLKNDDEEEDARGNGDQERDNLFERILRFWKGVLNR